MDHYPFNKAKLSNIGYKESQTFDNYRCFIFHDADFLAADDRNRYDCPTSPRHMSPACEKFNYELWSTAYFGGVIAVDRNDMEGEGPGVILLYFPCAVFLFCFVFYYLREMSQ